MIKDLEWELLFVIFVDNWFDDFLTAVRLIHLMWMSVYKLNKSNEIKDESLSYRTVVNDFQTQVKKMTDARPEWVGKDAFPTFTGKDTENETDSLNSEAEAKMKKTKNKTDKQLQIQNTGKKNKRQWSQTTDQTTLSLTERTQCWACKQDHDLHVCYYLFSNKVSSWFKSNQQMKELVKQNLKNDSSLAEKVKWLQKSMNKIKSGAQNKNWLLQKISRCKTSFFIQSLNLNLWAALIINQYLLKNLTILDLSTTIHIFNEITWFLNFKITTNEDFIWADNSKVSILDYENVDIQILE